MSLTWPQRSTKLSCRVIDEITDMCFTVKCCFSKRCWLFPLKCKSAPLEAGVVGVFNDDNLKYRVIEQASSHGGSNPQVTGRRSRVTGHRSQVTGRGSQVIYNIIIYVN